MHVHLCLRRMTVFGAAVAFAIAPPVHAQQQQDVRITGRVMDASEHMPIPTAAVLVTGTTIGQNTSDSGTFNFRVPADAKTFTVRRIGYLAQTVPIVAGKTDYTVALRTRRSPARSAGRDRCRDDGRIAERRQRRRGRHCRGGQRGAGADDRELARRQGPGRGHRVQQRRRAWRRPADPGPRHHVDLRQRRAALRGRRRHREQPDGQRWRERHQPSRAAACPRRARRMSRGAPSTRGQRSQPHCRHQSRRHREHRDPQGRVRVGDLRLEGIGRRDHHHDEARHVRARPSGT